MSNLKVTVCACTFRRPDGLKRLLDGLSAQVFTQIPPPDWKIVIADNEGSDQAKAVCDSFRTTSSIPLTYVHEPKRGIPHARNACLDHALETSDFFAMLDDDEDPEPDWLEQLVVAQAATNADAIQGKVVPTFPEDSPEWVAQVGFFGVPKRDLYGKPRKWTNHQELTWAATNNVLVRCAPVQDLGLRFDPRLAFTGGSDVLFFSQLKAAGYNIAYAEYARVKDIIPANRACLSFLLHAQYRRGHNKLYNQLALKNRQLRRSSVLKRHLRRARRGIFGIAGGIGSVAKCLLTGKADRESLVRGLLRSADGAGALASALGIPNRHYLRQ